MRCYTHIRLYEILQLLFSDQPRGSDTNNQRAIHRNSDIDQDQASTSIGELGLVLLADASTSEVASSMLISKTRRHRVRENLERHVLRVVTKHVKY